MHINSIVILPYRSITQQILMWYFLIRNPQDNWNNSSELNDVAGNVEYGFLWITQFWHVQHYFHIEENLKHMFLKGRKPPER